jgi:serine/threonine protein kinase
MSLTNLENYMHRKTGRRCLHMDTIQILATRMVLLLDRLHATGQVHRDLKPDNILIKETGEMVLADFGSVGLVGKKYDDNLFGTVGFTAPYVKQRSKREKNNVHLDIWSLGATILWMAGEVGLSLWWAATVFDCLDLKELNDEGPVSEEECKKVIESRFPIATQPLAHSFVTKVSLVIRDAVAVPTHCSRLVSCFSGSRT